MLRSALPALFQALRAQGAELISVPAAFTRVTGEAHWEILLRARAIENQCMILAPAQVGAPRADPPHLGPLAGRRRLGQGAG